SVPRKFHRLVDFGIAVVAVALALVIRQLVDPVVGDRVPFATLLGAVALSVGVGGVYPAVLATVLGYLGGSYLFLSPRGALQLETAGDWIPLAGYLFACSTIVVFGALMRHAQRRLQEAANTLEEMGQRKDQLLATVAHELRNPLAPIRTAVQVLKMDG